MANQHRIGKVATKVTTDERGVTRVIYHNTAVVTVEPNGRVTLDHGGWMTSTTKTRMNQAANQLGLGFSVWQAKGEWYVQIGERKIPFDKTPLMVRNGADIRIENQGTLYTFAIITEAARAWVESNVQLESYQWLGKDRFAVEHRYAGPLAEAMADNGLEVM